MLLMFCLEAQAAPDLRAGLAQITLQQVGCDKDLTSSSVCCYPLASCPVYPSCPHRVCASHRHVPSLEELCP